MRNSLYHNDCTRDEETTSGTEDGFHFSLLVQEDGRHGSGHWSLSWFLLVTGQVVDRGPEFREVCKFVVVDESELSGTEFRSEAEIRNGRLDF